MHKILPGITLLLLAMAMQIAHAAAPTPEQIRQFQSLSPAQQQQLLSMQGQSGRSTLPRAEYELPEPFIDSVRRLEPITGQPISENGLESLDEELDKPRKLTRFGASLFAGEPSTFAPVNDIPVPTDYTLGPGDQLKVLLYGGRNEQHQLIIDRNGAVMMPGIGPVQLAGMSFSEATADLKKRIETLGIGISSSITLGEMRSFRIFVMGESRTPGAYLVSGMATITHALYVSGGISDIGSFRKIELKRSGRTIATLDLYDLLIRGDTNNDVRLQPGDTVFIPVAGKMAAIDGQIMRPAIYELKNENSFDDLIRLAGGLKATAYQQNAKVTRITPQGFKTVQNLALAEPRQRAMPVHNGDLLTVFGLAEEMADIVTLNGELHRPGERAWQEGLSLLQLLPARNHFKQDADLSYVLIIRREEAGDDYRIINASWQAIAAGQITDIPLRRGDQVFVFSRESAEKRQETLDQSIAYLNRQSSSGKPPRIANIHGEVRYPGTYPVNPEASIRDLIQAAGGLHYQALATEADLIRYEIAQGEEQRSNRISLNIPGIMAGQPEHNIPVQAFDEVIIKRISNWRDSTRRVTLQGEVRFPGTYTIQVGETLEELLLRAGGFTPYAEPKNAIFTRESVRVHEEREMENLADELEKNLLMAMKSDAGLTNYDTNGMLALGQSLIARVRSTPAIGRVVISLDPARPVLYRNTMSMELRDGDLIFVPEKSNEVLVTGEVVRSVSMIYRSDLSIHHYIDQTGGITQRADRRAIYVVRGDGSVVQHRNGFFSASNTQILPGDTIVVPLDVERVNPLIKWTNITSILANFAVTAATLKTLGVIK
ncbi:MAG: SLBB domain-containing protein [Chromatiales bacterium]|nr:SLBB domain-containing protein [Chromatiales bacterium]